MDKIVIIFDNSVEVPQRIKTIVGNKKFGDIVLKRKNLFTRFKEIVCESKIDVEIIKIDDISEIDNKILNYLNNKITLHFFANSAVIDRELFINFLKKIVFVKENIELVSSNTVGFVFKEYEAYKKFLDNYQYNKKFVDYVSFEKMNLQGLYDISVYANFLSYISGGFDSRYFNSLEGDNYTVTKKSTDKKKMKMEYTFYYLLPEKMRNWMVMPYDYKEEENYASYTMERLPMTDLAIRWTHEAVDTEEFCNIMDKTFYFINLREKKKVSKEEYRQVADKLYLDKLDERIEKLKQLPEYEQINNYIKNGTKFNGIDDIVTLYKEKYNHITNKLYKQKDYVSVIGHGDVFFANMLYSKEINLLRLIDPKGALKEEDLWTDPYYDVAKLSHSVCGNYDFFNTGLYDIVVDKDMNLELNIHFDNTKYKEIFKEYLNKNGFDYNLVRLYESSLFLSMLPLHIDNPHKVLGFILNAISILEEI